MNIAMLADAALPQCGAGSCPPHAIIALAGAVVIGFAAGFLFGRRCKCDKKGGAPKKPQQSQPGIVIMLTTRMTLQWECMKQKPMIMRKAMIHMRKHLRLIIAQAM